MAPSSAVPISGADQQLMTGPGIYRGLICRETAGATAVVQVRDGIGNTGTLLDVVSVAANGYTSSVVGDIRYATGLWVEVVSGTVEGSVRIG